MDVIVVGVGTDTEFGRGSKNRATYSHIIGMEDTTTEYVLCPYP